ncbi:hypothetical protein TCAL_15828 [Tigriopus californicus]|uniref:Uncharacterized protein n=1 Tax=Tigriopus californicus TaxID=6832 RepID=A0A553NPJ8_TIGCA|nr:hypothetical protein TCAL_15828 [Tigriopus californicus]
MSGQMEPPPPPPKWMTLVFVASLLGLSMPRNRVEGQESRMAILVYPIFKPCLILTFYLTFLLLAIIWLV